MNKEDTLQCCTLVCNVSTEELEVRSLEVPTPHPTRHPPTPIFVLTVSPAVELRLQLLNGLLQGLVLLLLLLILPLPLLCCQLQVD